MSITHARGKTKLPIKKALLYKEVIKEHVAPKM